MALSPKNLSEALRRLAARVDRSERPSRELVARELRRVLAAMGETTGEDGAKKAFSEFLEEAWQEGEEDGEPVTVGAGAFQDWLQAKGGPLAGAKVEHGDEKGVQAPPGEKVLDFQKLREEVADEWELEEAGWDEYYVSRAGQEG